MTVLQVGIREDAVDEEQHCTGKDEVVQASPDRAANTRSQERRDKDSRRSIARPHQQD